MSTANSPVSICSNALLLLGAQPINDFNENNDRSRLVSNLWDGVRDELLREHPWNCALKRVLLAPDIEKPEFDFQYKFSLPADYIRVLSIGEYGEKPAFAIEGRSLLINAKSIKLRYVYQNKDVTTYDSALIHLLVLLMAAKAAYAVTQSTSLAQYRYQVYQEELRKAKAVNGLEYPPETLGDSTLLEARYYG